MRRAGVGARTLAKLTGIPRTAIDNWREGTVRRPRHWRPLVQIAKVLTLSEEETDDLLSAAGYACIVALADNLPAEHPDRRHLDLWLARSAALPYSQLRAAAADFVGRGAALNTLLAALRDADGAMAAIAGIRGMAGVGKTELAVLAANRLRNRFPDGQLMVNLRAVSTAPLTPAQALKQVIHVYAPDAQPGDDLESLQRRYCALLSGRRVLILADDASDAAHVRPLSPPAGCALLVTSRRRFSLPGMSVVDLEVLTEAEAVALLRAICDRVSVDEARQIAAECGYLPLALRIGGGVLLNDPALHVRDLLAALADRRQRLGRLRDPDDPQLDVAASLALSYTGLDETTKYVFRQLGVFVTDFTTELAVAVVAAPAGADVIGTLRMLLRHNIIEYDPGRARWRLHDLVRDLACDYLEAAGERENAMWRYAEAVVEIAEAIQQHYLATGAVLVALAHFDAVRPHLDAGRQWAAAHAGVPRGDRLLVADSVATQYVGFLRYDLRGDIAPQAQQALAAARRLGDRHGEGIVLNRLGRLHCDLGEAAHAVVLHEQQLALASACGDQTGQARALNNLASANLYLGHPRLAIQLHERQLATVQALGICRGEAIALGNLGRVWLFLGEGQKGLEYLVRAHALARESGDRHGEAVIMGNLGYAYLISGDAQRAANQLDHALAMARSMGDRHLETTVLYDLSQALIAVGRVTQGLEHGQRALTLARAIGARQAEANALMALAQGHDTIGEKRQARTAYEQALVILAAIGDQHGQAECKWRLGLVLIKEDRPRAMALLHAALTYQQEIRHTKATEHAAVLSRLEAEVSVV